MIMMTKTKELKQFTVRMVYGTTDDDDYFLHHIGS